MNSSKKRKKFFKVSNFELRKYSYALPKATAQRHYDKLCLWKAGLNIEKQFESVFAIICNARKGY
jgi:hypothetical protein